MERPLYLRLDMPTCRLPAACELLGDVMHFNVVHEPVFHFNREWFHRH